MSRAVDHPLVRVIMHTIERALASPYAKTDGDGGPAAVASMIVTLGNNCEDFIGWDVDSLPPLVLAYALHCPDDTLDAMADKARQQLEWVEWWDREGHEDEPAQVSA